MTYIMASPKKIKIKIKTISIGSTTNYPRCCDFSHDPLYFLQSRAGKSYMLGSHALMPSRHFNPIPNLCNLSYIS